MKIVTRGDFDGLASSVLLTEVHEIREIRFAHPKDVQDGKVPVEKDEILVNVPYVEGCGLWFDHHVSEEAALPIEFEGRFELADSCARVIYNHYHADHAEKLDRYEEMLEATDHLDAAKLSLEDVTNPSGWILLGLTIDPRSGLGPEFRQYFRWLVEYVKELPLEKAMKNFEIRKRTDRILHEQSEFKTLLEKYAHQDENVIITDFRGMAEKPVGNRFLVYTMFPGANVEVRLFDGHQGQTVCAVGRSIFNRTCSVNVGELCREYGGGGHAGAGTTQLPGDVAEEKIAEIIARLKSE